MTKEQYYTAKSALKAPLNLTDGEERNWFLDEIKKLRRQLNVETLREVLADEKHWRDKMQSSV